MEKVRNVKWKGRLWLIIAMSNEKNEELNTVHSCSQ